MFFNPIYSPIEVVHISQNLLAANKRSARTQVCRPNNRTILHSQHYTNIGFSNIFRDHCTTVAAMFPFFRDINAVIGAFWCIPLDFILQMILYIVTFKPSKSSVIFWGNTAIASIYSALGMLGAIYSIRQIVLDANKYSLLANI
ncbi:hypothetical protein TIFTF001_021926 [Ficus carica]|uniref:Amino acid transporter transmembrane domain-containing protein n=1 Tax=Ficus carica TaxID=3494 RepID=A0AA88AZ64_FICCA|nr:hypothetical protein TIFTF001_021926 [Ficus carica]